MQAVCSRLEAVTAVTDLVGTRIYPVVLTQGTAYPAIRLATVDQPRNSMIGGDTGSLVWPRIQIDSYGETYASAASVAAAVRGALKRQAWTQDSVEVLDGMLDQVDDEFEGETRKYRVRQDFIFCFRE